MNQQDTTGPLGWRPPIPPDAVDDIAVREDEDNPLGGAGEFLHAVRRRHRGLILWVLFCLLLAGLYLYRATPEFVATTQLVLEPRRQVVGTAENSASTLGPTLDSAQADSQLQVVKAERSLRYVFETLNLVDDPVFARTSPGWFGTLLSWTGGSGQTEENAADASAVASARAFQAFSDRIGVRRIGQSYALEVSFRGLDPQLAARMANSVTAAYIRDQVNFRAATVQRGTEFLQNRIADIKAEQLAAAEAVRTGIIPDIQFIDSDARVISAALPPLNKAFPQTILILILAGAFGVLSGIGAIAVRHRLDRTVTSRRQVARVLRVDHIGVLPRFRPQKGGTRGSRTELTYTAVIEADRSEFTEAMRVLRTTILSTEKTPRHLALGVASWSSGEGRSSVASNLAFLVAASRERVTLIDADFRDPALSRAFAPDAAIGLDEALLSRVALTVPLASPLNRSLDFVPAVKGGGESDLNVFVGSTPMQHLLRSLHKERDVIIDLPPMSLSSDTQAIGHLLDGVILVVEAHRTAIDEMTEAVRTLKAANTRVLCMVINKMPPAGQGGARRRPG